LASFTSGTSSPVFAAFLAAFLVGIAAGAAPVSAVCERPGHGGGVPPILIFHLFFSSPFGPLLPPLIAVSGLLGFAMVCIFLLSGFVLAKTLAAVFPVVAHFAVLPDRNSGRWVSVLYMANIIGSALGSLLTGFVLVDIADMNAIAAILS